MSGSNERVNNWTFYKKRQHSHVAALCLNERSQETLLKGKSERKREMEREREKYKYK